MERLKLMNRYVINQKTILITGKYDSYGKLCTLVLEGETPILVDKPPLKVIGESLHYYGRNLKGAVEGAKSIIGEGKMSPFIVCEAQDICLFPHISPSSAECIWFNHTHIINTHAKGEFTIIELSNGHSLRVKAKLTSFNTKKQKAGDLRRIVTERASSSIVLYVESKKEYKQCKLTGSIVFEE